MQKISFSVEKLNFPFDFEFHQVENDQLSLKMYYSERPFTYIKSNITKFCTKMLIDTGAALTLISSDLIKAGTIVDTTDKIELFGISGYEKFITTIGSVQAKLNNAVDIKMFLLDRRYMRNLDIIFGFDAMKEYDVKIDMINKMLRFQLK